MLEWHFYLLVSPWSKMASISVILRLFNESGVPKGGEAIKQNWWNFIDSQHWPWKQVSRGLRQKGLKAAILLGFAVLATFGLSVFSHREIHWFLKFHTNLIIFDQNLLNKSVPYVVKSLKISFSANVGPEFLLFQLEWWFWSVP